MTRRWINSEHSPLIARDSFFRCALDNDLRESTFLLFQPFNFGLIFGESAFLLLQPFNFGLTFWVRTGFQSGDFSVNLFHSRFHGVGDFLGHLFEARLRGHGRNDRVYVLGTDWRVTLPDESVIVVCFSPMFQHLLLGFDVEIRLSDGQAEKFPNPWGYCGDERPTLG